jgi:DNA-nicking Smr family endonuclease
MSTGGSRKEPRLSPQDAALWDGVTRSVRPLRKRKPVNPPAAASAGSAPKALSKRPAAVPASPPALRPAQKPVPPLAPLDRKVKQKIARGRAGIDARLDLHGHTQAEAHDALLRFLRRAQAKGERLVLVITGKGGRSADDRGVLKRAVPLWLSRPDFRDLVLGFAPAATAHGGEGALYVRLRKARV